MHSWPITPLLTGACTTINSFEKSTEFLLPFDFLYSTQSKGKRDSQKRSELRLRPSGRTPNTKLSSSAPANKRYQTIRNYEWEGRTNHKEWERRWEWALKFIRYFSKRGEGTKFSPKNQQKKRQKSNKIVEIISRKIRDFGRREIIVKKRKKRNSESERETSYTTTHRHILPRNHTHTHTLIEKKKCFLAGKSFGKKILSGWLTKSVSVQILDFHCLKPLWKKTLSGWKFDRKQFWSFFNFFLNIPYSPHTDFILPSIIQCKVWIFHDFPVFSGFFFDKSISLKGPPQKLYLWGWCATTHAPHPRVAVPKWHYNPVSWRPKIFSS